MSLAKRIHEARKKLGISQKQLAAEIGVRPSSISDWERGRAEPNASKIAALLQVLKVDLDYLYQDLLGDSILLRPEDRELLWKYHELNYQNQKITDTIISSLLDSQQQNLKNSAQNITADMIQQMDFFFTTASAGVGNIMIDDEPPAKINVIRDENSRRADFVLQVSGNSMTPKLHDRDLIYVKKQPRVEEGEIGIFYIDGRSYVKMKRGDYLHSVNPEYGDIPLTNEAICFGKVLGKAKIYPEDQEIG